jgi:phosphonate transport system ATP-binding protein
VTITLTDVRVTYPGGVRALEPTSLTFQNGQVTVLLGPSGAGKSTLLRCVNLLTRPTSGSVSSAALGVLNAPRVIREHRRRTGIVFQQHQLIGRLTALRNTLVGRLGHHGGLRTLLPPGREDCDVALASLDRVGLLDKALARVRELSGGEQQRVGIARALAQEPDLLLADEPVASLDPTSARQVLALLRGICRESGLTAVVSLHQVALAHEFADRMIGLSAGRVVFDGPPGTLDDAALTRRIYRRLVEAR